MNQQQAEDEFRELIRETKRLVGMGRDILAARADSVDPDNLSDKEAVEFAQMLRRLREAGLIRGH
jgi:hypothetical protein